MSITLSRAIVVGGSAALFLVAAKAHGRQLRLERELAGFATVTFRAPNPPFVEALWHRERVILFWSLAAGLAVAGVAWQLVARRLDWPLPLDEGDQRSWVGAALVAVVWPMATAFAAAGLASAARLVDAVPAAEGGPTGLARIGASGAAWWAATIALAIGVGALAFKRAG